MVDPLSNMNQTATIKRPTGSQDAGGTPTNTFITVKEYVPCAMFRANGREVFIYDKTTEVAKYIAQFLPTAGVRITDRVVVNSTTYEVIDLDEARDQDGSVGIVNTLLELSD